MVAKYNVSFDSNSTATRGARQTPLIWLCLLLVGLASGCASKPLAAPSAAYQTLSEQNYEFQTVWEASIEAMKVLGFTVKDKNRVGDENKGNLVTEIKITKRVAFFGTEYGQQLSLEISPGAKPNQHTLKLAATDWTREVTKNGTLLWKYKGVNKNLVTEFEKTLESRFSTRYQRKN